MECENAYRFPTIIRSPCSASSVPSEAQMEAIALVEEKEIKEEMNKEVKKLFDEAELPEVKKELQELAEKLGSESSQLALQELVKKQKELRLKSGLLRQAPARDRSFRRFACVWERADGIDRHAAGFAASRLQTNVVSAAMPRRGQTMTLS